MPVSRICLPAVDDVGPPSWRTRKTNQLDRRPSRTWIELPLTLRVFPLCVRNDTELTRSDALREVTASRSTRPGESEPSADASSVAEYEYGPQSWYGERS